MVNGLNQDSHLNFVSIQGLVQFDDHQQITQSNTLL